MSYGNRNWRPDQFSNVHLMPDGEALPTTERIYLNNDFADNPEVKRLGGRFDPGTKLWYVPPGVDPTPFKRWFVLEPEAPPAPTSPEFGTW